MSLLVAFSLLAGCGGNDADADGHSVRAGDCNDADGTVFPGAEEICDGLDNDCDGAVDEFLIDTFYADADGDGYAGRTVTVDDCAPPAGFFEEATDCDDLDASSHPGGSEVCDGADNDCDGSIDDNDDSLDLSTQQTFYYDSDGDGFGTDAVLAVACEAPSGFVVSDGDCDDSDASLYPGLLWFPDLDLDGYGDTDSPLMSCTAPDDYLADGSDCDDSSSDISPAAAEVCDGIDNDCDSAVDDDDSNVDTSTWLEWLPDADGDGFGGDGASAWQCTAPSGHTASGGDCDDSNSDINPSAVEVCNNGVDDNCDDDAWPCGFSGTNRPADAGLTLSASGTNLGYDFAVGDLDGDSYPDLVLPGYAASDGTTWLVYGPSSVDHTFPGDEDAALSSSGTYDYAGKSVASGGDIDGDGYDDLLIGAYGDDDNGNLCGAAFLVYGGAPLSGALTLDDDADAIWYGAAAGDTLGTVVRLIGDLDDDGHDDFVLGGRGYDDSAGAVFLVYGASELSGIGSDEDADASLVGDEAGDEAGDDSTAAGSDVDGDGYADLLVGVSHNDTGAEDAGAVALLYGGASRISGENTLSDADALLLSSTSYDYLGIAVAGAGDLNGDGYDDVLIGATGYDAVVRNEGATWVIAGQSGALSGSRSVSSTAVAVLTGSSASDYSGAGLAGAGDFNGDGSGDVLIGATGADTGSLSASGAGYLVYGPLTGSRSLSTADAVLLGGDSYVYTGQSLAAADINSDGLSDVLISSYGADAVYAFFGGGL